MKVYDVLPGPLTDDKPIQITRGDIDKAQEKTQAEGSDGYWQMLELLSQPEAVERACLVPGTTAIRWMLTMCIFAGRLTTVAVIALLVLRLWIWSVLAAVVAYIIVVRLQSIINYEIGARLFALDQHLAIDNVEEQSPAND